MSPDLIPPVTAKGIAGVNEIRSEKGFSCSHDLL